jgi:hypothetical protein
MFLVNVVVAIKIGTVTLVIVLVVPSCIRGVVLRLTLIILTAMVLDECATAAGLNLHRYMNLFPF